MSLTAAMKCRQIIENLGAVIAIQMMGAAQALDFRKPAKPGRGVRAAYEEIRKVVSRLEDDRVLYPDINAIADLVRRNVILEVVEGEVGSLS
jgi:histidine ammonia-lyase